MKCAVVLILVNFLLIANTEFVTKKFCNDVNPLSCSVHNVQLEPCQEGPAFCGVKRGKHNTLSVDFTPKFLANDLKVAIYGDDENKQSFKKIAKSPSDICDHAVCPFQKDTRRNISLNFSLDKTFPIGKFPLKVKLWHEGKEDHQCCFTFYVKVHK